jgi:hypothetical protein
MAVVAEELKSAANFLRIYAAGNNQGSLHIEVMTHQQGSNCLGDFHAASTRWLDRREGRVITWL